MFVSVIIPTYNRKDSLSQTLNSLAGQNFPNEQFEVIVVDDGSTDDTPALAGATYPFNLKYIRQSNQGDAHARNLGACKSNGDVLVFLDDDITVEPDFITGMVKDHEGIEKLIIVGTLQTISKVSSIYTELNMPTKNNPARLSENIDFTGCLSGFFSIRRSNYIHLGLMQPVTNKGSSLWCDVEFAYRAYKQDFVFKRNPSVVGYHNDHSFQDLRANCARAHRAAKAAVLLFHRHPELVQFIPMFDDKLPITWRQDTPRLIIRKLVRHIASSQLVMWGMEQLTHILEQYCPCPALLRPLYRWVIGGYIFQGYQAGLQEYGEANTTGN